MPNSRELATFLVTITGVAGMSALAGWMWPRSADLLRDGLTIDRRAIFDPAAMFALLIERSTDALLMLAPLAAFVRFVQQIPLIAGGGAVMQSLS